MTEAAAVPVTPTAPKAPSALLRVIGTILPWIALLIFIALVVAGALVQGQQNLVTSSPYVGVYIALVGVVGLLVCSCVWTKRRNNRARLRVYGNNTGYAGRSYVAGGGGGTYGAYGNGVDMQTQQFYMMQEQQRWDDDRRMQDQQRQYYADQDFQRQQQWETDRRIQEQQQQEQYAHMQFQQQSQQAGIMW